jgi:hypothetical protein
VRVKILLTATVTPQILSDLHIQDPAVRRRQYVESLRRWSPVADRHGATLVLVENSGEDLGHLAHDALGSLPESLRLITAPPPTEEDVARGKGAAEAAMMDLFCETFLGDPAEAWYKVTGRLFVRNFSACIPGHLPPGTIVARVAMHLRQMDTRFFGASAGIWHSYFTAAGAHVRDRDEVFIEKVLMRRTLTAMGEGAELLRFAAQPAFFGRSGTHAERVYDSPASRLKRLGANQLEKMLRGPLSGKQY